MKFPGQHEGERIEFLVRKHWVMDIKIAVVTLMLCVIPAMMLLSAFIAYWPDFFNQSRTVMTLAFLVYLLYALLIIYIKWLNEELDLIIVTNKRVINLDQVAFMERTVSESTLGQIQDVKGIEKGILSTLLHYGNLEIHTASHKRVFFIENINDPFDIARKLLEVRNKALNNK
ncbi:hypothetical protein COW94_04700 [Candidatus Peregrinibacteria bacterium CG22_combo_CG10-13_8_21_14_all_44_10]|nr:MAG: hypothetical protein AUK45_03070 [Candidatus Peregrinibacteria bacterium CG2_30_44_17]PIP65875.1 MAG: hypothetical protein COW94_04700 [Candidatus Peregrinibacteria bacterium CG22_combo_CG10-13_8_21_14_all_44_10]PIS04513.1 MAG: hypothetical protein COT83_00125 [Candidatus Peregrinibacteria bacterium CG10_big_fil_rev_8_21_14_0_10_44_7]PIX80198.1 MAG: hypothetical protein COZ35_01460 [Candidatus Peregrinibacteria bacterium CG_4_10_14_3_um_filter_44_21]